MNRSIWKGPFSAFLNKPEKRGKIRAIWGRSSMILPTSINKQHEIYNGKNWVTLKVVEEMVGHKFGEFATTRKKASHKDNKRKQSSKKKASG